MWRREKKYFYYAFEAISLVILGLVLTYARLYHLGYVCVNFAQIKFDLIFLI